MRNILDTTVTTIVSRRSQFQQVRLVDHLTPYDAMYILCAQQGANLLQQKGINPSSANHGGLGIMYENMIRQAVILSFTNIFYLLTWMLIIITLELFMKNTESGGKIQPGVD